MSYLRTLPAYRESEGVSPPIPTNVIENEAVLKFLAYALHDIEALVRQRMAAHLSDRDN